MRRDLAWSLQSPCHLGRGPLHRWPEAPCPLARQVKREPAW